MSKNILTFKKYLAEISSAPGVNAGTNISDIGGTDTEVEKKRKQIPKSKNDKESDESNEKSDKTTSKKSTSVSVPDIEHRPNAIEVKEETGVSTVPSSGSNPQDLTVGDQKKLPIGGVNKYKKANTLGALRRLKQT